MATRNEAYPSKYLNADIVGDEPVRAKIKGVTWETVGDKQKLVMHWAGPPWTPFPLNVTNFDAVAAATGKANSDNWGGEEIEVRSEMVRDLKGKMVPGVRLYAVPKPDAGVKVAPNARARAEALPAAPTPPASAYGDADNQDPDDDIPF